MTEKNAQAIFVGCGITNICVYLVFYWYMQNHYHVWIRESRYLSNVILIPGLTILLYAYYRGYKALKDYSSIGLPLIIGFGIAAAMLAVLIPSFYSYDLFAYINYGWQQARYHANPYCLLLAGTEGYRVDKMFTDTWALNPMPYGFAFGHLTRIICQLSGGILQNAIWIFKATNFIAWALLGTLVYVGAQRFSLKRPDLSLYLYLWSPLLMLHALSGCHNDILMTLPAMVGLLCATYSIVPVAMFSIPLVVLGSLVKYVWAIAIPFLFLFFLRKKAWKVLTLGSLTGLTLGLGLMHYYSCRWNEVRWTEFGYNLGTNTNSLPAFVENLGYNIFKRKGWQLVATDDAVKVAVAVLVVKVVLSTLLVALIVKTLVSALRTRRAYTMQDVTMGCVTIILFTTCAFSGKFYPWYIIMFFPAALWLPESSKLRKLAITLSCTQVLAMTSIGHGHVANFLLLTLLPMMFFAVAVIREKRSTNN